MDAPPSWADISHEYLVAIHRTGLGVRAMPLGGAYFNQSDPEGAWSEVAECFTAEMDASYVNVVCAPPGMRLGTPIKGQYEPEFALVGLLTVGVPNLAITQPFGASDREIEALRSYDCVLAPSTATAIKLRERNVDAQYIAPDPALLRSVLEGLKR